MPPASTHRVEWRWLKGHAGHVENERADELAREEIRRAQARHDGALSISTVG